MAFDEVATILVRDLPTLRCGQVVRELRFDATRKWRFDWALPHVKVAVEVNGGTWVSGRHNRGTGYLKDLEKLNSAQAQGWRVFQFSPAQVIDGSAMAFLRKAVL